MEETKEKQMNFTDSELRIAVSSQAFANPMLAREESIKRYGLGSLYDLSDCTYEEIEDATKQLIEALMKAGYITPTGIWFYQLTSKAYRVAPSLNPVKKLMLRNVIDGNKSADQDIVEILESVKVQDRLRKFETYFRDHRRSIAIAVALLIALILGVLIILFLIATQPYATLGVYPQAVYLDVKSNAGHIGGNIGYAHCELIVGGGYGWYGDQPYGDGLIVDWCAQAVVQESTGDVIIFW